MPRVELENLYLEMNREKESEIHLAHANSQNVIVYYIRLYNSKMGGKRSKILVGLCNLMNNSQSEDDRWQPLFLYVIPTALCNYTRCFDA